jgi:hypothetical protein
MLLERPDLNDAVKKHEDFPYKELMAWKNQN